MKNSTNLEIGRIGKCMDLSICELLYPVDHAAEAFSLFLDGTINRYGLGIITESIIDARVERCNEVLWLEKQGYLEFGPGHSHFTKAGLEYIESCYN